MRRLKIAAIVTEYRKYSHAQHIVDRYLYGYGWDGEHHRPEMDVVGMYTDQVPESDESRARAEEFESLTIYPTVAEALTLGTEKLAVDGVLLIGEHGDYPTNEKGQRLYPRYELFQQIVQVFRDSGRSVPVFNDKHLSWNWDWAVDMVKTSRELEFALMAGSSLPVARRLPELELAGSETIEEGFSLALGGVDSYDFHAMEALQSIVERRRGGETGVKSVQAFRGPEVWERLGGSDWEGGGCDWGLFEACMSRSHQLQSPRQGFSHRLPTREDLPRMRTNPALIRYESYDGMKSSVLVGDGLVGDFTVAVRPRGKSRQSTLMFLPYYDLQNFFSPLVRHTETMFATGVSPLPIERTLLTTGLVAAGVESLFRSSERIETPHLRIGYEPTQASTYWSN